MTIQTYCTRCALPSPAQHPSIAVCLSSHQGVLHNLRHEYDVQAAARRRDADARKWLLRVMWKLIRGRGEVTFSKIDLAEIPSTAGITVNTDKAGGVSIAATEKETPMEQPQ